MDALPPDLISRVLSFLPSREVLGARAVSTTFASAIHEDDGLWMRRAQGIMAAEDGPSGPAFDALLEWLGNDVGQVPVPLTSLSPGRRAAEFLAKFGPLEGMYRGMTPSSSRGLLVCIRVEKEKEGEAVMEGQETTATTSTSPSSTSETTPDASRSAKPAPSSQVRYVMDIWRSTETPPVASFVLHLFSHPATGSPLALVAVGPAGIFLLKANRGEAGKRALFAAPQKGADTQQCPQLLLMTQCKVEHAGSSIAEISSSSSSSSSTTSSKMLRKCFRTWLASLSAQAHAAQGIDSDKALSSTSSSALRVVPSVCALERLPAVEVPSSVKTLAATTPSYSYLKHIFPLVGLWSAPYGGHGIECVHVAIEEALPSPALCEGDEATGSSSPTASPSIAAAAAEDEDNIDEEDEHSRTAATLARDFSLGITSIGGISSTAGGASSSSSRHIPAAIAGTALHSARSLTTISRASLTATIAAAARDAAMEPSSSSRASGSSSPPRGGSTSAQSSGEGKAAAEGKHEEMGVCVAVAASSATPETANDDDDDDSDAFVPSRFDRAVGHWAAVAAGYGSDGEVEELAAAMKEAFPTTTGVASSSASSSAATDTSTSSSAEEEQRSALLAWSAQLPAFMRRAVQDLLERVLRGDQQSVSCSSLGSSSSSPTVVVANSPAMSSFWGEPSWSTLDSSVRGLRLVVRKVIGDSNVPSGQSTLQVDLEPRSVLTPDQAIPALPVVAFPPGRRPEIRNLQAIPFLSAHAGKGQINMLPSRWDPGMMNGVLFVYEAPVAELIQRGVAAPLFGLEEAMLGNNAHGVADATPASLPCFSFLWRDEDDFQHIIDYKRVKLGEQIPTRLTGPPQEGGGDDQQAEQEETRKRKGIKSPVRGVVAGGGDADAGPRAAGAT